jgi:membrane protein
MGVIAQAEHRVANLRSRGAEWAESRDPASASGVAIAAWRRYEAVDGPQQSALLALYFLIAIVPALLVIEEYLETTPGALANSLVHHYSLSAQTAELLRSVLVDSRQHELGSALLAVAAALFFGLGFGRVLQLVHVRAWGLPVPSRQADTVRYALVLLGLYGLILLLLVQLNEIGGDPSWANLALAPGWVLLLAVCFAWAARLLTHDRISWRDLAPGATLSAIGVVALMLVSSVVMELWVNLYARDYGGFGVVMAIFFWIAISSAIVVWAAAVSPPLAERRAARG